MHALFNQNLLPGASDLIGPDHQAVNIRGADSVPARGAIDDIILYRNIFMCGPIRLAGGNINADPAAVNHAVTAYNYVFRRDPLVPPALRAHADRRVRGLLKKAVFDQDIAGFHQHAARAVRAHKTAGEFQPRQLRDIGEEIVFAVLRQATVEHIFAGHLREIRPAFQHFVCPDGCQVRYAGQLHGVPRVEIVELLAVGSRGSLDNGCAQIFICTDDRMVIAVHVRGVVAMASEMAALEAQQSRAGGEMRRVGVRGHGLPRRRDDFQAAHQDIPGSVPHDAHAAVGMDADILKRCVLRLVNQDGRAEVERVRDVELVAYALVPHAVKPVHPSAERPDAVFFLVAGEVAVTDFAVAFDGGPVHKAALLFAVHKNAQSGHGLAEHRLPAEIRVRPVPAEARDHALRVGLARQVNIEILQRDVFAGGQRDILHEAVEYQRRATPVDAHVFRAD